MKWPWNNNSPRPNNFHNGVIAVGDEIPAVQLAEGDPENLVNVAELENGVIVGIPGKNETMSGRRRHEERRAHADHDRPCIFLLH